MTKKDNLKKEHKNIKYIWHTDIFIFLGSKFVSPFIRIKLFKHQPLSNETFLVFFF